MELFLNDKLGKITVETDEAHKPKAVLIIAHGAGAGMHHPFMQTLGNKLSTQGISSVRFNFPYMEQGRKSPGSPKSNIETWRLVIEYIRENYPDIPVFISGKSYGGRMASHLISEDAMSIKGIVYFGFPLHAPGRDSKDRADHLGNVEVPQLFLQGSRDKLANIDLITEVVDTLQKASMTVLDEGDHSFNVPKRTGKSKDDVMEFLVKTTVEWISKTVSLG